MTLQAKYRIGRLEVLKGRYIKMTQAEKMACEILGGDGVLGEEHRNPSRDMIEVHDYLNRLKTNRKC